jgi:hypothetical protein
MVLLSRSRTSLAWLGSTGRREESGGRLQCGAHGHVSVHADVRWSYRHGMRLAVDLDLFNFNNVVIVL